MARARATGTDSVQPSRRTVPRAFNFHWGGGQIIEEAAYTGTYAEPAIQLLEYEGHSGAYGIRFCYYSLDGRFQRSPMMIDGEDSLAGPGQPSGRRPNCARCSAS